jgi:O-6-methylguanine DNA methyltransferase
LVGENQVYWMSDMKQLPVATFGERVWQVVCAIPRGEVLSYREVAKRAGFPGAARAVGTLMKQNFDPARPCHRVIRSDGTLGEYNRGAQRKKSLLKSEGVVFEGNRVHLSSRLAETAIS